MKLNDSCFDKLEEQLSEIGGKKGTHTFDNPMEPLREIKRKLETSGIEVERDDIQSVGSFLTYKGEILAILYILNSHSSSQTLLNNDPTQSTPKFHFTWCKTLDEMTRKGRFARYVLSRSKSNRFRVEALEREPADIKIHGERHMLETVRLFPCQNCLNELGYRGFHFKQAKQDRLRQVDKFSIQEYLDENDGLLTVMKHLPKTMAKDAKSGGYTKEFSEISRRLREQHGWTCTKCGVDMRQKKAGLHVHHINGVKSDNRSSNLQVLCALCHKGIDEFHKTMDVNPDIERYIKTHRPQMNTAA